MKSKNKGNDSCLSFFSMKESIFFYKHLFNYPITLNKKRSCLHNFKHYHDQRSLINMLTSNLKMTERKVIVDQTFTGFHL